MPDQEITHMLNELKPEIIEQFYKRTVIAISVISLTYSIGLIIFIILLILKSYYCILGIFFPLLGYIWLTSYGAKHVNNHYGLKKTSAGTLIYSRRKNNYSAFGLVHIAIFLFSSIFRLIYEINNLILINLNVKILHIICKEIDKTYRCYTLFIVDYVA